MKRSNRIGGVCAALALAAGLAWYLNPSRATAPASASRAPEGRAGAAAAGGGPSARGGDAARPGPGAPPGGSGRRGADAGPVPVTLVTLQARTVPVRLRLVGRAEAFSTVSLRSRIDGQVLSVDFQPGEPVRRGQTMVRLDDRTPRAQVAQARANLARDQANLSRAVADLKRAEDLVAKGFVSSAQVDAARATMASLKAVVEADRAALDVAEAQLGYTRVVAPIDGVAGSKLVFPGSIVRANDTELVVINQVQPIQVRFPVPEARLPELRAEDGRGARPLAVAASIPGDPGDPLQGRLSFIDNAVDPATGTISLRAEFANEARRLTPGQFVEVDVLLRELANTLVIPAEAQQDGANGTFVYVARSDGTVELRPVRTAPGEGASLIVIQGLSAGEQVVVDGQLRLVPGARYQARAPAGNGAPGSDPGAAAAAVPSGGSAGQGGGGVSRRPADPS